LPLLSTATPLGQLKAGLAEVPSFVTACVTASMRRTRLFHKSATMTLPLLSTATPVGPLKAGLAEVPRLVTAPKESEKCTVGLKLGATDGAGKACNTNMAMYPSVVHCAAPWMF